jgi:hypothetical protein
MSAGEIVFTLHAAAINGKRRRLPSKKKETNQEEQSEKISASR